MEGGRGPRTINPKDQYMHCAAYRCLLLAALTTILWSAGAWSQTRTIKIISPFPAGGGSGTLLSLGVKCRQPT